MHKFMLSDDEMKTLEYSVSQTINKIEGSIIFQKHFPSSSKRIELIESLEDLLLDLECVHSHMFEGGDD